MASQSSELPIFMRTRRCTFQFEFDYSKSEDLPIGESISSPTFSTADGYDWNLEYYPRGDSIENNGSHVSLYLNLEGEVEDIIVESSFALLGKKGKFINVYSPEVNNFTNSTYCWGYANFMNRDTIKELYCVNGIIVISCSIRVLDEIKSRSPVTEPKIIDEYSGGLCEHIEKLWQKGDQFDVTFEVEGENISAHKLILAARSPVFEAQLFGPMAKATMECIKIDEMKAEVFKALLLFVYTDELAIDGSSVELLQGLFAAADRYSLDKLALLCEKRLEKNLSVDTVLTILFLADRHSCVGLKQKCLEFASSPDNFLQLAITEEYLSIMCEAPSLFSELIEKIKCSSHYAKKQRTS